MAEPRTLVFHVQVEDEGGPDDYEKIMRAFDEMGAQILDEKEV